ncbi:porin [Ruegeria arenilitoris]|uniref:porin n=1 Tax=Ruegeria arenilitoris TaxID=1173585 RepID=UPI00147AB938|nr:porin [Ruegeria arenilitoris]
MKNVFIYCVLTASISTTAAHAVEVTGGYLDLGYSTFTDSDFGNAFNLNGSGELAFSRSFSTQLDLGGYRFQDADENVSSWTLHANLHTSVSASLGAYYGRDYVDGPDLEFYGIEACFDAGPAEVEAYLGRQQVVDFSDVDGTLFGIAVSTDVSDQWQFTLSYDLIDDLYGLLDYDLYTLGADYYVLDNTIIYGNLGVAHISTPIASGSTNEAYVAVGVRMNLGNKRGTTFNRRGVVDKLPGL